MTELKGMKVLAKKDLHIKPLVKEKKKGMMVAGISNNLTPITILYIALAVFISWWLTPLFSILHYSSVFLRGSGILLTLAGVILYLVATNSLLHAHKKHRLITSGLYAIVPNPMCAAHILFTIPGIALIANSWLILSASLFMYIVFRIYIHEEESYLQKEYGRKYEEYRQKVWFKFL